MIWLAWMCSETYWSFGHVLMCFFISPATCWNKCIYNFPLQTFHKITWNFQMKAMEEEVLIKNGEIKILRDSLHQTESILEEQRRSHFLLEQEKTQALSEKEKEFSKKVIQRYVLLIWTSALPAYWVPLEAMPKVAYKSPRKISAVVCWKYFCYQLITCTFLWGSVVWKRT